MQTQFELTLPRPVDRVFAFLADPRNRPRWQSSLRSVQMLSEGEPRVGMSWRERPGGLVGFDMRISALEPNRLWAEQFEGAGIRGQVSLRFAAQEDATQIRAEVALELPGPMRLAAPLIRTLLSTAMRRDLARVADLV